LAATTTKLSLTVVVDELARKPGILAIWLELLDALPHVETLQIAFQVMEPYGRDLYPVYSEGGMPARFRPVAEQIMTSFTRACEQKGR
jgi:hypothetical protein